MAEDPRLRFEPEMTEEEYRRRHEAKAKRRKKRRTQRLILLGAFALAAILLIVVIVMVFRAIFGKKDPVSSSSASVSYVQVSSTPQLSYPTAADATVWNLKLVNANNPLPEAFEMPKEQLGGITQGVVTYYFDVRIVDTLKQMINDCNAVEGHSLAVTSGYRGPSTQNDKFTYVYNLYKGQGLGDEEARIMATMIEPPASYSEHQTGLAVDFVTGTVQDANLFGETPEYAWLVENAANYGFILRYPAEYEDITGYKFQPYHWRYVGVEEARDISGHGICLELYLQAAQPADATGGTESTPASTEENNSSSVPQA